MNKYIFRQRKQKPKRLNRKQWRLAHHVSQVWRSITQWGGGKKQKKNRQK